MPQTDKTVNDLLHTVTEMRKELKELKSQLKVQREYPGSEASIERKERLAHRIFQAISDVPEFTFITFDGPTIELTYDHFKHVIRVSQKAKQ